MATAHFSTAYDHAASAEADSFAEGVLVSSAMFGAIGGAVIGATTAAGLFPYASVLFGTAGVILGSVIAGAFGRCVILPALNAFTRRNRAC